MRNQKSDIAGFLFGLMLLAGLGQTYGDPPLGFDTADNPFHPWSVYNPSTQTGTCNSNDPCQTWDWWTNGGFGVGTCQTNTPDSDGDSKPAYATTPSSGDWSNIDTGCIVLEDWNQDGTCDHRVYDANRDQVDTPFEPVMFYHQYFGSGMWVRIVAPSICTGWLGV